ncbi:MAG: hypothetical protein E6R03_02315 [Hyphomicrobiaceae bacterium]|nr:MAG: hypothetical protein E6R03_02315 [Hyphomicrobiaceae bacterium]
MNFLELRTLTRQRADMESSDFVGETELGDYINLSARKLYNLLLTQFEDYFIKDPAPTYSLGESASSITLPSDFYKLKGLDWLSDGGTLYVPCKPFDFGASRECLDQGGVSGTYRLWYVPQFVPLQNDTDELSGMLRFENYVIVDAAITCLQKEESDVSFFMAEREKIEREIKESSGDRDLSESHRIRNVRGQRSRPTPRYHLLGGKILLVQPRSLSRLGVSYE